MEYITLVAMLTDYEQTYEVRKISIISDEEGEETNERLFISTGNGD